MPYMTTAQYHVNGVPQNSMMWFFTSNHPEIQSDFDGAVGWVVDEGDEEGDGRRWRFIVSIPAKPEANFLALHWVQQPGLQRFPPAQLEFEEPVAVGGAIDRYDLGAETAEYVIIAIAEM